MTPTPERPRPPRRFRRAAAATAGVLATGVLLTAAAARALEPDRPLGTLVAETWTTERGLPQNSVNALLQTRDGYLWVGTFGGLARFDGVAFTVFDGDGGSGLPSSRIVALLEDRDGGLWVGTEDRGVTRFDGERFADPLPTPLADSAVWALAEDRSGAIWIAHGRGVSRFAAGELTHFGVEAGLPGPWVRGLAVDGEGALWAATDRGAARFVGGRFEIATAEPVWSFSFSSEADLAGGGEALIDLGAGGAVVARRAAGRGMLARVLWRDRGGALWIGGERLARRRSGAMLLDLDESGRFGSSIRSLLEDREGSLWLGTDGGGLVQLRTGTALAFTHADGLAAESVLPIVEDRAGRIWIGGWCGGLTRFEDGRFAEVALPAGLDSDCVSALAATRDGALWVAHHALFRLADGEWHEQVPRGRLGTVHAIVEDRRGGIWVASERGLARVQNGSVTPLPALVGEPVWGLVEGRDGALRAGLRGAVARIGGDGSVTRLELATPRGAVPVRDLWETPEGVFWVATYGAGLARIAPDGTVTRVGTEAGLAEPYVSRLLPDGAGALWFSGNRGLYRVTLGELEGAAAGRGRIAPRAFGVRDGLRVAEANGGGAPAGWRARDGRLWFPTVRGVAVVDPRRIATNPLPPPVVIEEVEVDGRRLPARAALELPRGARRLEIRYTGLGLARPDRIRFRHRLVGFDSGWQEAEGRRFAVYTGLPAGRYRFELTAANEDGVWNREPATLELAVVPRWFETLPVRLAAFAALVALLAGLHRVRLARVRRRAAELGALVTERTAELTELNENLERIVAEQTGQIRETRDMALLTLAKLAELRDGTTGEHLDRIALYSRRLAEAIARGPFGPLGEEFVEELFRSSPLHDIGKVAIPDAVLNKPGPLTEEEWEIMKSHTTIGGDALRRVIRRSASQSFLTMAMEIAYAHHERWDGAGYPKRLAGEATPLAARIVALVDAYDAITSARPYKVSIPHEEAVARILADDGRHFDPRLVEAFRTVHEDIDRIRRQHPTAAAG